MTPEPLDPCPVCGNVVIQCPSDAATLDCVVCSYHVAGDRHRRLCAEVALARVVMKHADDFVMSLLTAALECEDWIAALARVREASK